MRALQNLRVKDKITAITLLAILVVTLLSSAVFVTVQAQYLEFFPSKIRF